jgi:hypothetical protein
MAFTSYDAARHGIGRAQRLLKGASLAGGRTVITPSGKRAFRRGVLPGSTVADMRRLSVVMAVAALDTYMHRLIVERAFAHDTLPNGLAHLDIGFEDLLRQADATAVAARANPHKPRPRVAVKRHLRDRLLRETFQNFDAVARALSMAGRPRAWPAIGEKMQTSPAEIKERLNDIVTRRNQIVHEGDYERLERPQTPRRNLITQSQARRDIGFIAELLDAIHAVVSY